VWSDGKPSGAIRYGTAGNATIRSIDAQRCADLFMPLLEENPDLVLDPRMVGPQARSPASPPR
jgi:hypothetical protein